MALEKLHLHSIMVHTVVALTPLAAVAFVVGAARIRPFGLHPASWDLLVNASLVLVLVVAIPSTLTGVLERNHMYANWHRTHRIKLALSMALIGLVGVELWHLLRPGVVVPLISPIGIAVVVLNNLVVFALCAFGLKMTLGRLGVGSASYVPDMFRDPPIDILRATADRKREPPKMIDIYDGMEP